MNPSNIGQWECVSIHHRPGSTEGTSWGTALMAQWWYHSFLNLSAALQAASGPCLPQFGTSSSTKQSCLLSLLPLGCDCCPTAWPSPNLGDKESNKVLKWNCTRVKAQKLFLRMWFNEKRLLSHILILALNPALCLRSACKAMPSHLSSRAEWLQMSAFPRACSHEVNIR